MALAGSPAACAGLTNPNLVRVRLKGTNHIFTTGGAIDACIDQLSRWTAESVREGGATVPMPRVAALRAAG